MLFWLLSPKLLVLKKRACIHKDRLRVRKIGPGAIQDPESVRVAVAPVELAGFPKPGQGTERIDTVAKTHEKYRTRKVRKGKSRLQVLHDEDACRANLESCELGKRGADVT